MSEEPKWDITKLTDKELAEYTTEQETETLRRKRENQWYVCMSCGAKMGYDYMEKTFDAGGCQACGHPQAILVQEQSSGIAQEAKTE